MRFVVYPIFSRIVAAAFLFLVVMVLHSCGFHLRKDVDIPAEVNLIAIKDLPVGSKISPVINSQLSYMGIQTLSQEEGANLIFIVKDENYTRRVLTVNAVGQVKEYELVYVVKYSIKNVHHSSASINNQKITIKRDIRFEPNEVLGSAYEESRLKSDMIKTAADQIIRRLPKAVPASDQ